MILRRRLVSRFGAVAAVVGVLGALAAGASSPRSADAVGADGIASGAGATVESPAARLTTPPRRLTVLAVGDVLTESRVRASAANFGRASGTRFDFGALFAPAAGAIAAADLAICNMELPIGRPGGSYGYLGESAYGGNRLLSPYEIAPALASVGFDRCSTATNHGLDAGNGGIAMTIEALNGVGISVTGTARTAEEANASVFVVDGVRVGHVSYTTYSNTGSPSDPWRLNLTTSPVTVVSAVERLRAEGAEVVLVSIHVSPELLTAPHAFDRFFVSSVVASADVDAVFVHGPHVVQPFEMVVLTPVWWSLGNFVSEMGPPSVGRYASARTADGLAAWIEFVEVAPGKFEATPRSYALCNDFADRTVRLPALSLPAGDLRVQSELDACRARTRTLVPDAL